MIDVRIEPQELEALKATLTPDLWQQPVADLIRDASVFALREAQSNARGLGAIPSSLTAQASPMGARVSTNAPGAVMMEIGRRAGAKLPPPDALARYGTETFPIARAVKRRGIRGRFFMRKAQEALDRSELPRLIARARSEIGARWESRR